MSDVLLYISAFFMVFLSCAIVCFCLRFSMWIYMEYWGPQQMSQHPYTRRCQMRDRQANVFTIHDENSRESRYNDIFFIEPNSVEAARIRAQLEKDDKDLPTYEEVMRMTSMNPTTTSAAAGVTGMTASNASVNTTETILSVPPYSEVDPIAAAAAPSSRSGNANASNSSATAVARSSTSPPPMPAAMVSNSVDITQQSASIV